MTINHLSVNISDNRDKQIQDLVHMKGRLMGRISLLESRIVDLESRLTRYQNPNNSGTSSIPPSKDENRPKKMQSLREGSQRKSLWQLSHTGHMLEMKTNPDGITDHIPRFCSCCGHDLSGITAELSSKAGSRSTHYQTGRYPY